MTIGIYSLYWEEQDLIYIGLSDKLETRNSQHLRALEKNKHSNYKVQNAYNKYGAPTFSVLEYCSSTELSEREIFWTNEFNSLNSVHGLNIVEPGRYGGYGTNAPCSKYSRFQILKVFSMLYRDNYTYKDICLRCKVPNYIVSSIKSGDSHTWLREMYPIQYALLGDVANPKSFKGIHGKEAIICSPQGTPHTISSIKDFCLSIDFGQTNIKSRIIGISRVLSKARVSYKGWHLPTNSSEIKTYTESRNSMTISKVIDPEGTIHYIQNISEFCRGLTSDLELAKTLAKGFSRLLNQTRASYRGWKRVTGN